MRNNTHTHTQCVSPQVKIIWFFFVHLILFALETGITLLESEILNDRAIFLLEVMGMALRQLHQ